MDDTCVGVDALNQAVCLHGFVLVIIQLHKKQTISCDSIQHETISGQVEASKESHRCSLSQ